MYTSFQDKLCLTYPKNSSNSSELNRFKNYLNEIILNFNIF